METSRQGEEAEEKVLTVYEVLVDRKPHTVQVLKRNRNTFLVKVNEKTLTAEVRNPGRGEAITIRIDGTSFKTRMQRVQGNSLQVEIGRKTFKVERQPSVPTKTGLKLESAAAFTTRPAVSSPILTSRKDAVIAPIAGRIVLFKANIGQKVEKGDCICILEAMKMENEITAPKRGVIKEIKVSDGATVNRGDVLVVIN